MKKVPFYLSLILIAFLNHKTVALASSNDVDIIMVGDILLHDPVENAALSEDGSYNYDFIFKNTRDMIHAADIAIVNQEVIIGGQELGVSGYPCFNAPYAIGDSLVNAGFDVVCHATNHSLDKGKKGLQNCYSFWKNAYPSMTVIGLNGTENDYTNVDIVTSKGFRFAILNYTYGTNGINPPKDMPHAVDMLDKNKIIRDLKYAEENADFTIVCPHWGTEYNLGIDSSQKKWTALFRKYGADLVIGTHPHVIEPIKMIEDNKSGITNNSGDGDMLVYYSLGNFVNWTSSSGKGIANRMVGGMAKVTVGRNKSGEAVIKKHSVTPLVCHLQKGREGVSVYPINKYTEEMGRQNQIISQDSNFSYKYCVDLCNKVWGSYWTE